MLSNGSLVFDETGDSDSHFAGTDVAPACSGANLFDCTGDGVDLANDAGKVAKLGDGTDEVPSCIAGVLVVLAAVPGGGHFQQVPRRPRRSDRDQR